MGNITQMNIFLTCCVMVLHLLSLLSKIASCLEGLAIYIFKICAIDIGLIPFSKLLQPPHSLLSLVSLSPGQVNML